MGSSPKNEKRYLNIRMEREMLFNQQRLFDCSDIINPLKCMQCTNFETHELIALKQHFKPGHTLQESKEKLYECEFCTFQTHSNFLILKHMFNLCVRNAKVKSEVAISEGVKEFPLKSCRTEAYFNSDHQWSLQHFLEGTNGLSGFTFCDFQIGDKVLDHTQCYQRSEDDHPKGNPKFEQQKLHKCKYCPFTTKYSHSLTYHTMAKHTDSDKIEWFYCELCHYKAKTKEKLNRHKKLKHDSQKHFKCEKCSFETKTKDHLNKHVLFRHTDSDKIKWFHCQLCSYKAKIKQQLKIHINVKHEETDNKRFKCETCPFETKVKQQLNNHILAKHTDAEKIEWFHCKLCSYKAKTKASLKYHIDYHHDDKKPFKCENCPYETKCKKDLKIHILRKHTNLHKIEWFHCALCSYKAKTKKELTQHINYRHEEEKRFKCENCPFETKTKSKLKMHITCRHTDPDQIEWFQCEFCSYKAKAKGNLRSHFNYLHRKEQNFKCDKCLFKTSFKETLKDHILQKHTNPDDVVWLNCAHCSYKTQIKKYLRKHIFRQHKGSKEPST